MNNVNKEKGWRPCKNPDVVEDSSCNSDADDLVLAVVKRRIQEANESAAGADDSIKNEAENLGGTDASAKLEKLESVGQPYDSNTAAVGGPLPEDPKMRKCQSSEQPGSYATEGVNTNSNAVQVHNQDQDLRHGEEGAIPGAYAQVPGAQSRRRPTVEATVQELDLSEFPDDLEDDLEVPTFAPPLTPTREEEVVEVDDIEAANAGLVTAFPVDEDDLRTVQAQEHFETKESKSTTCGKRGLSVSALVLAVLVALAVATAIILSSKSRADGAATSESTPPPIIWALDLPNYTMAAILLDKDSAQAKAYDWLLDDPSLDKYTEARKLRRFVLATLYHSTNGRKWRAQNGWMVHDSDECVEWYNQAAIIPGDFDVCNGEGDYTTLALGSNALIGTIPPELGLLTSLQLLLLGSNYLAGSIPPMLWELPSLGLLALHGNHLTGPLLPENLQAVQHQMIWLDLHDNKLQGAVPSELGLLTACTHLGLNDNLLSGTIPTELGETASMERIALSATRISGSIPSGLFGQKWDKLTHLELRNNLLSSTIPTEIGLLTSLKELYLYDCHLSGTIPSEIAMIANMTNFVVSSNALSGSIPEELWTMTLLEDLFLFGNSITGSLASKIEFLTNLKRLNVEANKMSAELPSALGVLTKLTHLGLSNNGFEGTLPLTVWRFSELQYLWVNGNVTGSIPSSVSPNFKELNLTGAEHISGTLPAELCSIPELSFDCSDLLCGCECACSGAG